MSTGNGVSTTNIEPLSAVDELIGNSSLSGSGRIKTNDFVKQITSEGVLKERLDAAAEGVVQFSSWVEMASVAGIKVGQVGRVIGNDTGTHIDVITGQEVANQGEYSWTATGWKRIGDSAQQAVNQMAGAVSDTNAALGNLSAYVPMMGFWPYPYALHDYANTMLFGVNAETGLVELVTNDMPGVPLLDPDFRWRLSGPSGNLLMGLKWKGGVEFGHEPLLDPDYQKVESTSDGKILRGVNYDGSVDDGTGFRGFATVYTRGVEGSRQVYLYAEGVERRISFGTDDNFAPDLSMGVVRYLSRSSAGVSEKKVTFDDVLPFADGITEVIDLIGQGQSTESGISSPVGTTEPPLPTSLLMFNGGILTLGNAQNYPNINDVLPDANIEKLVPAYSRIQEAPVLSAGRELLARSASDIGAIVGTHSIGRQSITALGEGSAPFNNALKRVIRTATLLAPSLIKHTPVIKWGQGQSDSAAAKGWYKTQFEKLRQDFTNAVNAATGYEDELVVITTQFASWTRYNRSFSYVPHEILELALQYPEHFLCAGPDYPHQHTEDGIHYTTATSIALGEMCGRAYTKFRANGFYLPLHIASAVRDGDKVYLDYAGNEGALDIDTTTVSNPGNLGFRFIDNEDGNAVLITNVEPTDTNTVTVTLSATPTGTGQVIGYADYAPIGSNAGPMTGARGNLRDNSSDQNWASIQQAIITTEG
ncbi:sialate O-acetylesterase [Brucella pseudogrignonensis]|uniref:sialate O-acetylesterase n=1 Tax=Brucella pseudogrignonensis TaxID=419475 RepID=UPI003ECDC38E